MPSVETIRGRQTEVDQYDGEASAVLARVEDALAQIGAEYTYGTVALMKADTALVDGDRVRTLGYYANRDQGAAAYDIITQAAHGGVPDGLGDHLLANGLVARLNHVGKVVIDAQYGVAPGVECSARWQEAFYSAADLASASISDGSTATFMGITDCNIKDKIYATARDGGTVELLEIYATAYLQAVVGGNLEPSTFLAHIPMMTVKVSSSNARWGVLDCGTICSGWLGLSVSGQHCDGLSVQHFDCYGAFIPEGANGAFKMENYNIKQWRSTDSQWTVDAEYTGYALVVGNKDMQFGRGEVGWCGVPLLLLDATPSAVIDQVEGRNIFRGYESEGTGGCVFTGIHPMAGRPGGPARIDNIEEGGPSLVEVWNNTNVCQINFADMDAGIIRIYGKGIELNYPNFIVGGANDPINDRAVVLDPVVRIYANGTNNPSKISIRSEQGVTVGFYDFEGNSWNGDFDAWNITSRQSTGLWTGPVTVKGFWDPRTNAFPSGSTAGDYWVVQYDEDNWPTASDDWVAGDGLIALVNGASTSILTANWEHNSVTDVKQRDESAGVEVTQGSKVMHSRDDNNVWRDVYAPGPTGEIRLKLRVAAGNPLIVAADETGKGIIDGDVVQVKNWSFTAGSNIAPVNDNTQNLGSALLRVAKGFFGTLGISGSAFGYETGAGGAVTQATSRTTAVTLNKACGQITMFNAAGSTTAATFTVNNTECGPQSVPMVVQKSGTNKYVLQVTAVQTGSFDITFFTTGGTASDAPVINFAILKAVAS